MATQIIAGTTHRLNRSAVDEVVEVPVLIVGGGPTGLTAAVELARFGVPSLLIERHPGTSIYPRAIGVNTRSMEILRGFGLQERVGAVAFEADPRVARSATLNDPDPMMSPSLATPPVGDLSPARWTTCSQFALEPLLREAAESLEKASLRFHTELVSFDMHDSGVCAHVVDRDSARRSEVRCRFLIAADGAASIVRERLGIDMTGAGVLGHNVAIHFASSLINHLPHRPAFLHRVDNDRAQGLFFTTDGVSRWVFNTGYRPDQGETPEDFTAERATQLIRDGSGIDDLDVDVRAVLPWVMQGDMATRSRAGHIFLAGDAAHRMTPAGALGMNTGIQDAHNLAWKLAGVLRGWSGEALLDTYEAERRPVAAANVDRSVALSALGFLPVDHPVTPSFSPRTAVDYDLGFGYTSTAIISDGSETGDTGGEYVAAARPGYRAPHCWLDEGETPTSTLDVIGEHLTLFHGGDVAWQRAAAAVEVSLSLPIHAVSLSTARSGWQQLYGIEPSGAVLVRPDGHVAWRRTACAADQPTLLLEAVGAALCREGSRRSTALAAAGVQGTSTTPPA